MISLISILFHAPVKGLAQEKKKSKKDNLLTIPIIDQNYIPPPIYRKDIL